MPAPAGLPNPAGRGFGFVNPNRASGEPASSYAMLLPDCQIRLAGGSDLSIRTERQG